MRSQFYAANNVNLLCLFRNSVIIYDFRFCETLYREQEKFAGGRNRFCQLCRKFFACGVSEIPALIFAKILPGTFVGFGILGTFLGFARGIHEIPIDKTSDEILKGISTLLSGMNTAFYTSIFGVILSVIFSILFQFPIHKIKSQVSRMKSAQMESEKIDTSMQDYVKQVRELTNNLVLAKESMETLPKKFKEVGASLEESISPVKETFSQMQSTLQNYAEQAKLMENASSEIGETLKNFSAANEKITQNISEIF